MARRRAESGTAGLATCARNLAKGHAVARAITGETGCPVQFVETDLASVADCRAVVAAADRAFGRVDMLVNAAGLTDCGEVLSTDQALFDRMFAINTRVPFFLIQESMRRVIRDGVEGAIVNIGSAGALTGQPFISPIPPARAHWRP